jgi:hypothetical protein
MAQASTIRSHPHLAFVTLRDLPRRFQEDAGQRLQDVRLVDDGDLLALVPNRILEGELSDLPGTRARVDA